MKKTDNQKRKRNKPVSLYPLKRDEVLKELLKNSKRMGGGSRKAVDRPQ